MWPTSWVSLMLVHQSESSVSALHNQRTGPVPGMPHFLGAFNRRLKKYKYMFSKMNMYLYPQICRINRVTFLEWDLICCFRSSCLQPGDPTDSTSSEDCLYLNVFVAGSVVRHTCVWHYMLHWVQHLLQHLLHDLFVSPCIHSYIGIHVEF